MTLVDVHDTSLSARSFLGGRRQVFMCARRGGVEREPGSVGRGLQHVCRAAMERARPIIDEPSGHGGTLDIDGPVVPQPKRECEEVMRGLPDGRIASLPLAGERAQVGAARAAQGLDQAVGESRALTGRAQLGGSERELGARGGVTALGELRVETIAPEAGPQPDRETDPIAAVGSGTELGDWEDAAGHVYLLCVGDFTKVAAGTARRPWVRGPI
jgi:hypothetical protein